MSPGVLDGEGVRRKAIKGMRRGVGMKVETKEEKGGRTMGLWFTHPMGVITARGRWPAVRRRWRIDLQLERDGRKLLYCSRLCLKCPLEETKSE